MHWHPTRQCGVRAPQGRVKTTFSQCTAGTERSSVLQTGEGTMGSRELLDLRDRSRVWAERYRPELLKDPMRNVYFIKSRAEWLQSAEVELLLSAARFMLSRRRRNVWIWRFGTIVVGLAV